MTSPSMVHRSGDTLVVRSVVSGNQLFASDNEPETDTEDIDYCDEYFDPDDNKNLPECKIRRNYSCVTCHFFTQNPRHYLYHLRDVHKEKVKIYECSNCLYASKHFQKLLRHVKMVHAATDAAEIVETQHRQKVRRKRKRPDVEPEEEEEELDNEDTVLNGGDDGAGDDVNKPTSDLKCSLCPFTTKHQGQLTRHEKQEHIKTKFFRCSKCSYVTHIKARFTKHVKYHSMPMIKCDLCDFRTPYKWNLDRHYKNHNGHGAFRCSACNFTADIKQSLTVHEMNHHVPPVGQAAGLGVGRRRNKVGASDTTAAEEAAAAAANTISGDTLTTMSSGLTISGQRDFSHQQNAEHVDGGNTNRKNQKLKISLKKFKATSTQEQNERHNFDTDFINPDDIIHHSNGNIYIKNKCKLCNFKTAWNTEMVKHERKVHNIGRDNTSSTSSQVVKKTPRPIPNLIPIQPTQNQQTISANSLLKIPIINNQTSVPFGGHIIPRMDEYNPPENVISQKDLNDMCAKSGNSALKDFASLFGEEVMFGNEKTGTTISVLPAEVPQMPEPAQIVNTSVFKKKNASFFDKLKEKLMTGENCNLTCKWCGHESKCLSESAGHQKTCGKQQTNTSTPTPVQNVTSSTRCQHCRQRCKSSIDLHNHLQVCNKLNDPYVYNEKPDITIKLEDEPMHEDSLEPHPMENVVFVWNNISPQPPEELLDRADELSMDLSIRVRTPESENSFMESENIPGSTNSTPVKMPTHGTDIDQITDGRRVFKCPHCSFWATTASRFHVHIVGHLNKKPFECSLCAYRSNWRWDITKHIRLKSVRDPDHEKARVLMTDETGRRNYSKYNKYLTQLRSNDSSSQDSNSAARKAKSQIEQQGKVDGGGAALELPKLTRAPNNSDFQIAVHGNPLRPPPPLKAANDVYFQGYGGEQNKRRPSSDSKKTLFKCKKCNFRDASRENILSHVKGHYRQDNNISMNMSGVSISNVVNMNNVPGNAESDEASVSRGQAPFRCGHCHQVSNWKHVIQRHCRLKHSGDVRVVIGGKNGVTEKIEVDDQTDEPDHMDVVQSGVFKCQNCPFSVDSQADFDHHLEMHIPKSESTMKCYFCPYYVTQKFELFDHLRLHGVINPEDYVNRAMQGRELASPNNFDGGQTFKRYKCVCCPYVSNSKSQFLYHKQFHRHRGGPFKCEFCSYNVTRRHLLHQHLKVHGVNLPTQKALFKSEQEAMNGDADDYYDGMDEIEEEVMSPDEQQQNEDQQILFDVPLVWVSKDGKFTKMFKCRFCPHVNMRKVNIQEHEKMHSLRERNPNAPRQNDEHHCTECSYICNNAGVLSSHLKVHQMVHGQIHCLVDTNKTDEEQISELTRLLNVAHKSESSDEKEFFSSDDQDFKNYEEMSMSSEEKILYFCDSCPARFLHEKELLIHKRFHGIRLFYRCDYCNYAARQRPHLLSHEKVHTEDYQDKTKFYLSEHPVCPDTPQPKTVVIFDSPSENKAPIWVVISNSSNVDLNDNNEDFKEFSQPVGRQSNKAFGCRKCPARFFKNDALKYHMTLHGCSNPYKCKYCDYAARTSSNLQKHHRVHEEVGEHFRPTPIKQVPSTSVVPISGTDLFEQRNEAAQRLSQNETQQQQQQQQQMHIDPQFGTLVNGNPKFVYPTYLRNGRMKEKRYKCHKCPSAFEKREQYKVHLSLHGSNQKYKCETCDYSVKYYANYVQHTRKHEMNTDAQVVLKKSGSEEDDSEGIREDGVGESSQPFSKLAVKSLKQQRGPLKLSIADRQTLMILQKRRASSASSSKESSSDDKDKDKRLFWCPHCPYTSYRRDAVDNHLNRHICVSGARNNYTCEHCDYTVPQSHFLREHVKSHFMPPRNYQPDGYLVSSEMELTSITTTTNRNENNQDYDDNEPETNSSNCVQNECVIFKDNGDNKFTPHVEPDALATNNNNVNIKSIHVNPQTGEFTEDAAAVSDTKEPKKSL